MLPVNTTRCCREKWFTDLLLLTLCFVLSVNVNSLEGRFEDDDLQQILDDIKTKRSFQY